MSALNGVVGSGVLLLGLAGCFQRQAVELSPEREALSRAWTAKLATPPTLRGAIQAQGTATMGPPEHANGNGDNGNGEHANGAGSMTVVDVRLDNVAPGGLHPWQVQRGRCGAASGDVLLMVNDEGRMLKVGGSGSAHATAELPNTPVPQHGDYSIAVLASRDNASVVIACGNFAPPPGVSRPDSASSRP
jgi:hypothetical protein